MSKNFYCANCGLLLRVMKKAMPKYGTIVNIVEQHKCLPSPLEFDLEEVSVPSYVPSVKGEFVEKINALQSHPTIDRRPPEHIKGDVSSSAPLSILEQIRQMIPNTDPEHGPEEDES